MLRWEMDDSGSYSTSWMVVHVSNTFFLKETSVSFFNRSENRWYYVS